MKVVNVNRIQVITTPDGLRKIADILEDWWKAQPEKSPGLNFFTSVFGDNARVDFFLDVEKMKP